MEKEIVEKRGEFLNVIILELVTKGEFARNIASVLTASICTALWCFFSQALSSMTLIGVDTGTNILSEESLTKWHLCIKSKQNFS